GPRLGAGDPGAQVGLDVGLGEGAVVDADLVDEAGEVLAVGVVAADPQGVVGGLDGAGGGAGGDLGAVDVEPQGGAVVGEGDVGPRVGGVGVRAADEGRTAAEGPAAGGAQGSVVAG